MRESIDPRHLLVSIACILNKLEIPYLITGGMAVVVWGRPRFTADIDIVVELQSHHLESFVEALKELGEKGYIEKETTDDKLSDEERKGIRERWDETRLDEIWKILVSKYSPEEWKGLVKEKIVPLVEGYMKLRLGEAGKSEK